jgi:hypothetical protein
MLSYLQHQKQNLYCVVLIETLQTRGKVLVGFAFELEKPPFIAAPQ